MSLCAYIIHSLRSWKSSPEGKIVQSSRGFVDSFYLTLFGQPFKNISKMFIIFSCAASRLRSIFVVLLARIQICLSSIPTTGSTSMLDKNLAENWISKSDIGLPKKIYI